MKLSLRKQTNVSVLMFTRMETPLKAEHFVRGAILKRMGVGANLMSQFLDLGQVCSQDPHDGTEKNTFAHQQQIYTS
jgi:hypothetical protein